MLCAFAWETCGRAVCSSGWHSELVQRFTVLEASTWKNGLVSSRQAALARSRVSRLHQLKTRVWLNGSICFFGCSPWGCILNIHLCNAMLPCQSSSGYIFLSISAYLPWSRRGVQKNTEGHNTNTALMLDMQNFSFIPVGLFWNGGE